MAEEASSPVVAVLDACVLYPPSLRDFLMWLAVGSVYAMRLTDAIHDEWIRNALKDRSELTHGKLTRTRTLMNRITPETLVRDYEELTGTLTLPDLDDRHVLAAAIHARASVIVTFNLKDFPAPLLAPYGIIAQSPDDFVSDLAMNKERLQQIVAMARQGRQNLKNPPKTVDEYLATLHQNRLTRIASLLAHYSDEL